MAASVPVPTQLRRPHPFVVATRRLYEAVTPDDDGRMRPGPREGVAHLIVSKQALRKALLYLQAIFAEAERRGWQVVSSRGYESTGVSVKVRGHAYAVGFQELHDRVPLTNEELDRWRKQKEWQLRWNPGLKERLTSPSPTATSSSYRRVGTEAAAPGRKVRADRSIASPLLLR